jgi:hypothetical protein
VAIIDHGRLQRLVTTGYDRTTDTGGTYRFSIASGSDRVKEMFPEAERSGDDEFELTFSSIADLNSALGRMIAGGVLVAGVVPSRSVLEQQFREAVGEEN